MDVKANKGEVRRCENKPGVRLWEDFRQKLLNTERRVGNMTEHVRHLEQTMYSNVNVGGGTEGADCQLSLSRVLLQLH